MPPKLANSVMTLARTAVSVDVSSAEKEEKYVSSLLGGGCNNILKKDLVTGLVHALALLKHHIVKVDQAAKDAGVSDKIPGLPFDTVSGPGTNAATISGPPPTLSGLDKICGHVKEREECPGECDKEHPILCGDARCYPYRHTECTNWHTIQPLSKIREIRMQKREEAKIEKKQIQAQKMANRVAALEAKVGFQGNASRGKKAAPPLGVPKKPQKSTPRWRDHGLRHDLGHLHHRDMEPTFRWGPTPQPYLKKAVSPLPRRQEEQQPEQSQLEDRILRIVRAALRSEGIII